MPRPQTQPASRATTRAHRPSPPPRPAWGGRRAPDRPAQCLPCAYMLLDRLLGSCPVATVALYFVPETPSLP